MCECLADGADAPQLTYHNGVRDGHGEYGQEEEHAHHGGVVDALGGPRDTQHAAVLVVHESDWPAEVVAVALDKVRPVALRVRAIDEGGQRDEQAERPDGAYPAHALVAGQTRLQRIHDADVAVERDEHQRQHARYYAHHLHVRLDLSEKTNMYKQSYIYFFSFKLFNWKEKLNMLQTGTKH